MTQFWKALTYEQQRTVLDQDYPDYDDFLLTLFGELDIEAILDTKLLHKDIFDDIMHQIECRNFNKKQPTWLEKFKLFDKFGGTVDYELNQEKFLLKMKQE